MDEPFNKFNKKHREYLHTADNDYKDIVNRFIQSVEQSSDAMNYLWRELHTVDNREDHEKIAHESLAKAESNRLYFNSFINLYSDCLDGRWLDNKKKEMELRIVKAKIAYNTVYRERRNVYELRAIKIALFTLCATVIIAVINLAIDVIQLF